MALNQLVTRNFHSLSTLPEMTLRGHLSRAEQKITDRRPEAEPKPEPQPRDIGTVVAGRVFLDARTNYIYGK
jgi:hypothetical protein